MEARGIGECLLAEPRFFPPPTDDPSEPLLEPSLGHPAGNYSDVTIDLQTAV